MAGETLCRGSAAVESRLYSSSTAIKILPTAAGTSGVSSGGAASHCSGSTTLPLLSKSSYDVPMQLLRARNYKCSVQSKCKFSDPGPFLCNWQSWTKWCLLLVQNAKLLPHPGTDCLYGDTGMSQSQSQGMVPRLQLDKDTRIQQRFQTQPLSPLGASTQLCLAVAVKPDSCSSSPRGAVAKAWWWILPTPRYTQVHSLLLPPLLHILKAITSRRSSFKLLAL